MILLRSVLGSVLLPVKNIRKLRILLRSFLGSVVAYMSKLRILLKSVLGSVLLPLEHQLRILPRLVL
jgi:hypothetical protein